MSKHHPSFPCNNTENVPNSIPKSLIPISLYRTTLITPIICKTARNAIVLVKNPINNNAPTAVSNIPLKKKKLASSNAKLDKNSGK